MALASGIHGSDSVWISGAAVLAASPAELWVAVDSEDQMLGTVTICLPGTEFAELSRPGELEFRMLAVIPGGSR